MKELKFYRVRDEYGSFSNFSKHPIIVDDKIYPTSEHYFQSKKFLDIELQEWVRIAKSAREAADRGRDRAKSIRKDWEEVKDKIMLEALILKFTQHSDLKNLLLSTKEYYLVEDSPIDSYWGIGKDKKGLNMLGKLLGVTREILFKIEEIN